MKDAKGHGSDSRGGSSFDRINAQRVAQGYKPMPEKNRGMHDFFDYMAGKGPKPEFMNAASATAGNGEKSAQVDTHPSMEEAVKAQNAKLDKIRADAQRSMSRVPSTHFGMRSTNPRGY